VAGFFFVAVFFAICVSWCSGCLMHERAGDPDRTAGASVNERGQS